MSKYELYRVVAGAVIHDGNGRFLLAQRHPKDDNQPGMWAIPAGHIEPISTEKGPQVDALEINLQREVREEIGVDIKVEQYLDSHFWIEEDYKKVTTIFLCAIVSGIPQAKDETAAIEWLRVEEIEALNLAPQISRLIRKADEMLKSG